MGKGIRGAVKAVLGDIPHFICHFHFLKIIGLMLFEKELLLFAMRCQRPEFLVALKQ